ncbi:hypothetical protein [Brevundimonas sp. LjRoot202]|uniref:hypothetical protein n=1 Tax=Brevundimonas sp. LjRoot202 TaxID=3342281 RepID=UPI003ECD2D85
MTPYDPAPAIALITNIQGQLDRLKALVQTSQATPDPKDPRNKLPDGKLTARGVEVCYRLFDAGKTRYAVSEAMDISYGAATHRQSAWEKVGGPDRQKQPLA